MKLEKLFRNKPYPGRFIVLGKIHDELFFIYGVTGRSPSSLNRKYFLKKDKVFGKQLSYKSGNKDLLEYPAVKIFQSGFLIANGNQIKNFNKKHENNFLGNLNRILGLETVEPDKYLTPRITGYIISQKNIIYTGLHIIRSRNEKVEYKSFPLEIKNNQAFYISTYNGKDEKPTKSFSSKPLEIELDKNIPKERLHEIFFDLLKPKHGDDYRVSFVSGLFKSKKIFIKNKVK